MDTTLLRDILGMDSTSGRERAVAEHLAVALQTPGNRVQTFEVGDGSLNVLASWGEPKLYFCTHCDTVPPYIPPVFEPVAPGTVLPDGSRTAGEDILIRGRGACDAKGQVAAMFEACKQLEASGKTDFALLILAGEETGSFGAKAYTRDCPGGDIVVVGEPTDGKMVSASKGTQSFSVTLRGRACHSGYPALGESAVERFVDFCNWLRALDFPLDPELGETTWNIGQLRSDNPQNILSPEVSFRLYFRTTFASEAIVKALPFPDAEVVAHGGDSPMHYLTVPGLPQTTVAFGSDAPQLKRFARRALCGPGSITVAHTDREFVLLSQLEAAAAQYVRIYDDLTI
ncbi:MAG: M20/M25/M40 family metallo-hydrolase [Bacteroidales bacterium]|nr:M20/M25/M40 family metallo-hydrolase [Bacteroidales bacterium]